MSAIGLTTSRAIIGEFYNRLSQNVGAEWVPAVSMLMPSVQETENYKWLGMSPQMRQWIGGRHAKGFKTQGLSITNLEYEATLEVLTRELRRDKTGQIMTRVRELADRANSHWASLLTTLIVAGVSGVCYDTQYFFDTDHADPGATYSTSQDNDLSIDISGEAASVHGTITAPSTEEMRQCILKAIAAIVGFLDDEGEPMNENANQFLIMTPLNLYPSALAACALPIVAGGEQNVLIKAGYNLIPVANARLTNATSVFYVFRSDGQTKPLIRQEEVPITIEAIAEGSELEFNEHKHRYGVWASRNVGYGYWQHACVVTMT
jgi:phage major head subunit gpT-like protein